MILLKLKELIKSGEDFDHIKLDRADIIQLLHDIRRLELANE